MNLDTLKQEAAGYWQELGVLVLLLPAMLTLFVWWTTDAIWSDIVVDIPDNWQAAFWQSDVFFWLVLPSLAVLGIVSLLPLHKRRDIALSGIATLLLAACGLALLNYLQGDTFNRFIAWGAIAGFILSIASLRISLAAPARVKVVKNGIYGSSDWLALKAAAKIFPDNGEVIIGECYRPDLDIVARIDLDPKDPATWGKGGKAPLLTFKMNFDTTHMLFFAGSGGYKTTSVIVPTGLRYTGPQVALDPAGEITPIVVDHRRNVLGRQVFVLDPNDLDTGFNVLDWITDSVRKEEDITNVAHMLLNDSVKVDSSTGSYFQNQAHNLLTGVLAYVLLDPAFDGPRTLRGLREILSLPEPSLLEKLRGMQTDSPSMFIRETLGVFVNMTEQTFSGVYSTAAKDTQWLSLPYYASMVCGDSFQSNNLAKGNFDVFINIPGETLKASPGIGRVIIGALLKGMRHADGDFVKRTLFMLDEVDLLGYMKALDEARDRMRKYGVTLMMMYQSVGQIERHYGATGAEEWFEGAALVSYAAVKSMKTAKRVSESCGETTVEVTSSSKSGGMLGASGSARATQNKSYQKRPLITPAEIIQTMRKDEQIIIVQGQMPLRCGRAIYFRRKDMCEQAGANRFAPK